MSEKLLPLVKQLAESCLQHNIKIACAESCTGGWLSHAMVSVPGSSQWFEGGVVSYSNQAKQSLLGVTPKAIQAFGAVSKEVAQDMAQGLLQRTRADITVAITGVAGPEGGSDDKPVGTVWVAYAMRTGESKATHYTFEGSRTDIRRQSVESALQGLIDCVIMREP